jgi:hypothetical protein
MLFFFLTLFTVNSQSKRFISFQTCVNKMDVFSGLNYEVEVSKFNYFASIETGIIKSVFQNRIFPRSTLGVNYFLIKKEHFRLLPEISYSFSFLNIDVNHYWNEYYFGYKVLFGNRIQLFQSTKIGLMNEIFQSELLDKRQSVNCFGYNIAIGLRYEI